MTIFKRQLCMASGCRHLIPRRKAVCRTHFELFGERKTTVCYERAKRRDELEKLRQGRKRKELAAEEFRRLAS